MISTNLKLINLSVIKLFFLSLQVFFYFYLQDYCISVSWTTLLVECTNLQNISYKSWGFFWLWKKYGQYITNQFVKATGLCEVNLFILLFFIWTVYSFSCYNKKKNMIISNDQLKLIYICVYHQTMKTSFNKIKTK